MRLNRDASTRTESSDTTRADPLVIIDLMVDLMFIADILINFRTTYLQNGEVVTNQKKIAINYVKGWFVIDTIAAIPFDLLLFGSGTTDVSIYFIKKTRLFKYIEHFTTKNWKFPDKKFWYFSYFCSKHRLWVLVRTASTRRF